MARYVVTAWYAYVFGSMRGMTAAEAAERTGVNAGSLSRWKSGQAPDYRTAVQFARGMGLDVLEALAACELITPDEANIHAVPFADLSVIPSEDLLAEIERRLSNAKRISADGGGTAGPPEPAGRDSDPDQPQESLRAGSDRSEGEEDGRGGEVLDRTGDAAAIPARGPGPLVSSVGPANPLKPLSLEEWKALKTPKGRWAQHHVATILGLQPTSWSKLLNGLIYPARLQTMQKIEIVFGWPVSEQVQLIPPYWEWPEQAASGVPAGEPNDLRYAMKLAKVVAEWTDANPRTVSTKDLTLHPSLKPINGDTSPRFRRKEQPAEEEPKTEEPKEEPQPESERHPLALRGNPLRKR